MDWIRKHLLESAFIGLVSLTLLVVLLVNLLSNDEGEPLATPTTLATAQEPTETPTETTGPSIDEVNGPEVPPIACETLITLAEMDAALGVELADFFERQMRGETCRKVLAEQPDYWLQVEPGNPADFSSDAQYFGVTGDLVDGIADGAVWFVGEDPEEGGVVGLLSVFEETQLGALLFRIRISRPDVDDTMLLEAARGLALAALPRFPGVVIEESQDETVDTPIEVENVAIEIEPVDLSDLSFEDNLLTREADGEWTLGEGLVATLRLFAREAEPTDVLRHGEVANNDGSVVVQMARKYLDTGPDDAARLEIARLLSLLAPPISELVQSGVIDDASSVTSGIRVVPVALFAQTQEPAGQFDPQDYCTAFYSTDPPCLEKDSIGGYTAATPYTFEMYVPTGESVNPWSDRLSWPRQAFIDSMAKFNPLGELQPGATEPIDNVHVFLSGGEGGSFTSVEPDVCVIHVGANSLDKGEAKFKQQLAYNVALCLVGEQFDELWWGKGLALYLSGVVEDPASTIDVYGDANLEHDESKSLSDMELYTSLLQRGRGNWSLFEYLHPFFFGESGIFDSRFGFPEEAEPFFHDYTEALTDGIVEDLGRETDVIPYTAPHVWVSIDGPKTIGNLTPMSWEMRRVRLTVESDMYACLTDKSKGAILSSWRPGAPWEEGDWSSVPSVIGGESTLVVTATGEGSYSLTVDDLVEDEDDCETDETPEADESDETPEEQSSVREACLDICRPSLYYAGLEVVISIEKDMSERR